MTTRTAQREYSVAGLRARCQELRTLILAPTSPLASAEEVRAIWPGGADNRRRGLDAWIECYAQLARIAAREEAIAASRADASQQLDTVVREAAARQPVPVTLTIGERAVYPKSAWALSWLDSLDAVMAPVVRLSDEVIREAEALPEGETLDALRAMPALAQGMAIRTWAWILLEPGVGLPFPDEGAIEPPDYTAQLQAEDLLAIYAAHRQMHHTAIAIMASAMPREAGGERSRLSVGGFLASYASEHGLQPSHVLRRWSFPEAMAAAVASYESHRVAEANAKRKQERAS